MRKHYFLFVLFASIISFVGFFVLSKSALATDVSFFDDTFDLYSLGNLPVPYYTFGGSGVLPVVSNDRYFGPFADRSCKFTSTGSIPRAKYHVGDNWPPGWVGNPLSGYFYYVSSANAESIIFGAGTSSAIKQYILFDTANLKATIEGHDIASFSANTWVYLELQLDYDLNKVKGCLGTSGSLTCSAWYSPTNPVSVDNDYFMFYAPSATTGVTYVDCIGCSYDSYESYSKFKPSSNPDEDELSMYIEAFKGKFPFGVITYIYDFFFDLDLPDVPDASLSINVFGGSFSILDFDSITNTDITIPGTETTITFTQLVRNFFILLLWFLLIEFLVWWALSLFGR